MREASQASKASQSAQNFVTQQCETCEGCFQRQVDKKSISLKTHEECHIRYPYTVFCGFFLFKHRSYELLPERILATIIIKKCQTRGLIRDEKMIKHFVILIIFKYENKSS